MLVEPVQDGRHLDMEHRACKHRRQLMVLAKSGMAQVQGYLFGC